MKKMGVAPSKRATREVKLPSERDIQNPSKEMPDQALDLI